MKPFSWSWSRHRTFETCRRRYWYAYYGSRQGWRRPEGDRARTLYEMKALVGRAQWVGQEVHEVAARALARLRRGDSLDETAILDDAARRARRVIDDARRGLPRLDPRRHPGFLALYYDGDPGDPWWEELVEDLLGQVRALLDHPIFRRLAEVPERIVEVEEFRRLPVGDVSVLLALDVLVDDGSGGRVVVDWKTGRAHDPDEVDGQLGVYALYVHRRYRTPVDRITVVHASTRDGAHRGRVFSAGDLARTRQAIERSADQMATVLAPGGGDRAEEDDFPLLEEGDEACGGCRYRRACGRG